MSSARFEVPGDSDITPRIDLFGMPKCKILTKKLSNEEFISGIAYFPSLLHATYIFFLAQSTHKNFKVFVLIILVLSLKPTSVMVSYYISSCFKLYCILPLGQFLKYPEEESTLRNIYWINIFL